MCSECFGNSRDDYYGISEGVTNKSQPVPPERSFPADNKPGRNEPAPASPINAPSSNRLRSPQPQAAAAVEEEWDVWVGPDRIVEVRLLRRAVRSDAAETATARDPNRELWMPTKSAVSEHSYSGSARNYRTRACFLYSALIAWRIRLLQLGLCGVLAGAFLLWRLCH
jgi:hypothetical protein